MLDDALDERPDTEDAAFIWLRAAVQEILGAESGRLSDSDIETTLDLLEG